MKYKTLNFIFNKKTFHEGTFNYIIGNLLNIRFDKEYNPYFCKNQENNYEYKDFSNSTEEIIEKELDSFFKYSFEDCIDSCLYKFLVIKTKEKYIISANICSLIFDYSSINKLYYLLDDLNVKNIENKTLSYHEHYNNYLSCDDFEIDSKYWNSQFINAGKYIKFLNIRSDNYQSKKIKINFEDLKIKDKFNFIMAVLSLYLSRIDNTKGCILKTIILNKSDDLGPFDKTTLLKIDYDKYSSFENYFETVCKAYNDAVGHTEIDVENYIDDLFVYSINDFSEFENISIKNCDGSALTFNVYKDYLELFYDGDLFSEIYIEHMGKNIKSVIDNLVKCPNQLLKDINILSDEDKYLLSKFCKGKNVEIEKDKYVSNSVRKNAIDSPEAIAIDDGVNKISFGQLENSSNSIANDLKQNHDIGLSSHVALMLPRSYRIPQLVVALNKIGATFISIDTFYPIKRIEYMLDIGQAEHIITTKEIASAYNFKINVIYIEDLDDESIVDVDIVTRADDLFTIFFTSGTTGLPKAVGFTNGQTVDIAVIFKDVFDCQKGDIFGYYLGFTFVASFMIYASLLYGAGCRIFNEEEQKDSLLLIKALKENNLNSLILPPSLGVPIYENEVLNLKSLTLAGSKLGQLSKIDRPTKIINFYGTTEIVFGITKKFDSNDLTDGTVPLGCPVANTWVYILDEEGNQMPIGVPGEICISRNHLGSGYINNPDLTNKSFVNNPLTNCEENKRMYRTGDVGLYNFDGEIEFIGRFDDQLSVRGFRIESDEILSIMKKFNGIHDIYLDVDKDNLIAYYTINNDVDINEVKKALKTELPYYMIPSLFIELDEITLNQNGKINKTAIKNKLNKKPKINIEDRVLKIVVDGFKEVLSTDFVLIDDGFVELGGNSLSAMKLQTLLKKKLNVSLSSSEIIELSTPINVSNHIKSDLNIQKLFDTKYTFDDLCPLSESQLNLYLDETTRDVGTTYNNPFKITFKKKYPVEFIKNIINKFLDAYPILSSRILLEGNNLFFSFDSRPEIEEKFDGSFVRPFELDNNLVRFLIEDNDGFLTLYIDLHHLIFDAYSINVVIQNLYAIMDDDHEFEVDDGILRQISFEKDLLDTNYSNEALTFFDEMLVDSEGISELLPSVNSKGSGEVISYLDVDNVKLRNFLQTHSITYNQFFSSVFAYTLSRFTGSSKVLFNLIEDGRGHGDFSNSVGMFVRTLPLIIDCKNQNVSSFLKNSAKLVNSAMKYDQYPYRVLVNKYDLDSDILFQYLPNISQVNEDIFHIEKLDHDENGDLLFYLYNSNDDKFIIDAFHSSKFSKEFIQSFVNVFKCIISQIMDVNSLSDIDYVSKGDLKFLNDLNETSVDIEYDDILDAFNDNLAMCPDSKLVSFNDRSYSYGEGAFIAFEISKCLKQFNVDDGDCVSFMLNRSEWYLLSILGILSNGSVFVPLDVNLPDERLKFMVNDTSSKVVIVDDSTYDRARDLFSDLTLLNVSKINTNGKLSRLPVNYNDLACILYTSGTTGLPKGVKNTRKSILNVCSFYADKYGLDNDDVYGLFSAIGFDVTIFVINAVIYSGACLSVVPEEIRLDMYKMNEYFIKQDVTHAFITTQVAKLFMNSVDCSYLDVLLVIGEKLGEVESPKNYSLVDAYGPTEAFAFVTAIENNEKIDYSSVGLMDYNMKCYVLDDELRRVPIGAIGELYLSGEQLADGYLNRPEKTLEAFVDNPFEQGIMYKTGDVVRILPDGTIGFIGRRDTQVKIRGNRLELGEVEATIRQIKYVSDVTVQTIKNGDNNELIAYVVASKDDNDYIMKYISQNKPDYMVPSFIVNLDEIPLNVNGKVDRKALSEIDIDYSKTEYVAPATEIEKVIVNAFENAFNMEKISVMDDFAKLGGNSLIAIRLISYLKDYNVSAADIMSLHTPKAIANNIKEKSFDLDIYSLEEGCPLNEPQLNIYLDIMTTNKMDSYFIPFVINISKEYGEKEIINALNEIFDAHIISCMCVSDDFEVPYLIKSRTPSISVVSDVDDVFIFKFLVEPFDLHDSLCRFLIVENDDEYLLYAVYHHLIFDERSIHVFKHDFNKILNGESIELDDSFLKVSAFNTHIKNTEEYVEAHEFYNSMLSDIDEVSPILDDVLPDGPGFASCNLDFDKDLFNKFIKKNSISEYILFNSVFTYTLSRFVGSNKVLFNIDDHGRDRFDNFDSIGMFVNTLPLLIDTEDMEISVFVKKMADLIYKVMRYNFYSYRDLAIEHDIFAKVLFQFFPLWLDKDDLFFNVDNKIINNINDFNMDLMVNINQKTEGYTLNVQYSSKYSQHTIKRFMDSYNLILSQMIRVDKLSDINYICPSDVKILDGYNQTGAEIKYSDILDAFNDNLVKYSNNKLVSCNDISYTYGEGAFIASEIANRLKDLGVKSGDFVPFLVPRSEWYLLINLAVLSIGALYVPLDDAYPDERLKFILKDIDSNIIIVTDETHDRARELFENALLINVSDIVKGDIGTLSHLDHEYNELASVFYTSGSTGVPKGVVGTRKAIVNLCQYYVDNYDLDSSDVYGLYTAIGFDVSMFVIAVVMYVGACLSVIPQDIRLNMDKLNEYFINQNITHSFITTQVGKLFMEAIDETSLDVLFVIGEKLGEVESPQNYQLIDSYGPTETFNFVTAINNINKIDYSSIGYVSHNMKAYILDNELRRVPIGAVGELYLSGRQTANGYLNREKETSESFIKNPFDDGVMYRTGDMVRMLPDGTLGIMGRRDGQVKIRGNRVELGEIEHVIRELNYIKDVTVQTIKNGDNNELVAYIVNRDNVPIVKSVPDHIKERKPEYMVPSFVVTLDEIPLNVNGKVDKKALPEVELDDLHDKYVAPTTETEKIIVDAFSAVFNQDNIGINDDFIKLGGESLTAIKLTSILSKHNIEFNARNVMIERTPYRIAQIIDYSDCDNSCTMIKKGVKNQNMFLIPPMTGFSFEYSNLVHSFDFEGNVYVLDDPKFKLSLEEIKKLENHGQYTLDRFYDSIKDVFEDGDILVGYSSGGIFSLLLAEKLEKTKKVGKSVLIDGLLNFKEVIYTRDEFYKDALENWKHHEFDFIVGTERKGAKFEKFVEISLLNVNNNFEKPNLNSPILYLSTGELYTVNQIHEKLDLISGDNEIELIESTNHSNILKIDYYKLIPYFK